MIRSMMRFSWAMSLFGVRQAQDMFEGFATVRSPRRATEAFDAVSSAVAEQLGEPLGDAFRTGDRWQRQLIDSVFGALDPAVDLGRGLTSKTLVRGSLAALRQSAAMLEGAIPPGNRVAWQELGNKLEAFESFQYAEQILGVESLGAAELRQQVEEAGAKGPYLRLWLTEGLGFAFAEAAWADGEPRELLCRAALDRLPEESLIPLHTGMGLSLARHTLPDLAAGPTRTEAALGRFAELCESNARAGFALAAYEALGLIVRQVAPERGAEIDSVLAREAATCDRREAFWHGLGRGLYFVATQALPGSTGRAVAKVRHEAPSAVARLNALSGLAWALTLVNFRQPEILDDFLDGQDFDDEESAAVGRGIASATLLWRDAAGEESYLEAFLSHRPEAVSTESWERLVQQPCTAASEGWPALKSAAGPGEIFHYRRG